MHTLIAGVYVCFFFLSLSDGNLKLFSQAMQKNQVTQS